jgi:hypothetical protein
MWSQKRPNACKSQEHKGRAPSGSARMDLQILTHFARFMSHHQKNTNHVQTINKVLTHPNYVQSLAQQKTNTQNNRGTTQYFLQRQKDG